MKDKQELIKAIIKYIHKLHGRLPSQEEVESIVDEYLSKQYPRRDRHRLK